MRLVTVDLMRALEKEAVSRGLSYSQLLRNAGRGLADLIIEQFQDCERKTILGLVGSGNNGGDTLVALSELGKKGWKPTAYLVKKREKDDLILKEFKVAGGKVVSAQQDASFQKLNRLLQKSSILLDGVLGTGIKLPLDGQVAEVLRIVAEFQSKPFTIAVDCPSGVDCGSSDAAKECIPADLTVCMAAVKTGLLRFPAFNFVGDLETVEIGLPEDLKGWGRSNDLVIDSQIVADLLPPRPLDSHKGTFGTAMMVSGSTTYAGAILLAGRAAYRIGVGLLRIAIQEPLLASLAGHLPEATWLFLPHTDGVINAGAAGIIKQNLKKVTAILLGPGWGTASATYQFMQNLLSTNDQPASSEDFNLPPMVVDADGLRLLAQINGWDKLLSHPSVLTPHPGEMSALCGLGIDAIQRDRLEIARRFAVQWGHVLILKGALTVIASPQGQVMVVPIATPALARAGSGDVLAGMITGLLAQGLSGFHAAICAAWIHARAGMLAADLLGSPASVLASDVIEAIPQVLNSLE
jgi:ADP-dependent NAD(P)H-hydrate dehydratase / NAD(P)H-hydrate epimerase